jgi:hypothetical protein
MGASLYDAAFATLGALYGTAARGPIAAVTLLGGFASTVCWPLSALFAVHVGWRGACFAYAAIQIVLALPVLLLALPATTATAELNANVNERLPVHLCRDEVATFVLLAAALTIGAAVLSVMGTHLIPLLRARGLEMSAAVAFGAILGPAQVGARVVELLIGNRYDAVWTLVAAALLVAIAALMMASDLPAVALAIALYGAGNGIGSVARGTVPMALFGATRYPVLMGRLGLPLLMAMALSPYLGGLAFVSGGAELTLALVAAIAAINVLLVAALRLITWRR